MASQPNAREHGLDALRAFAFLALILYHSGMGFVRWDWHVKNPDLLPALEYPMMFVNRWRLPLLFFVSGAGVAFSLRRRGFGEFARERVSRLLPPLLVGMFVIVPPQIYWERLQRGPDPGSYAQFWRTVFGFVPYPAGSLSWHHLWFVAYVLVFALISIPVFAWLRSANGASAIDRFASALERWPAAVWLINVPNLIVSFTLGTRWPTTHDLVSDWANLTGSLLTFLWGFVFASSPKLLGMVERRRREFVAAAIVFTAAFFALRTFRMEPFVSLASAYMGMAWIFALIGVARAAVTRSTPFLRYATEAVFPFYIFHQTITVGLVYWLAPAAMNPWLKWLIAAAGTFAGSAATFEIVRRAGPLRPLFGMKRAGGG